MGVDTTAGLNLGKEQLGGRGWQLLWALIWKGGGTVVVAAGAPGQIVLGMVLLRGTAAACGLACRMVSLVSVCARTFSRLARAKPTSDCSLLVRLELVCTVFCSMFSMIQSNLGLFLASCTSIFSITYISLCEYLPLSPSISLSTAPNSNLLPLLSKKGIAFRLPISTASMPSTYTSDFSLSQQQKLFSSTKLMSSGDTYLASGSSLISARQFLESGTRMGSASLMIPPVSMHTCPVERHSCEILLAYSANRAWQQLYSTLQSSSSLNHRTGVAAARSCRSSATDRKGYSMMVRILKVSEHMRCSTRRLCSMSSSRCGLCIFLRRSSSRTKSAASSSRWKVSTRSSNSYDFFLRRIQYSPGERVLTMVQDSVMRYRYFAYYWPIEILLSCIIAASRGGRGGEGMVIVGGVVVVDGWIWGVVCIIGCMSEKRSARGTVVSKTKEGCEERLYHSQRNQVLIYSAQFYREYLLICTPISLTVYHSDSMVKVAENRNHAHCAAFVPHTSCIIYAVHGSLSTTDIFLWDFKASRIASRLSIKAQIESVLASRRCLLLQSQEQLYVLHFPTLRPIYNGNAGNGFHIVSDLSREGLTLAHTSEKKGEVVVRNFTNIETNKLLQDERSRRLTRNSRRGSLFGGKQEEPAEEEIKHEICIAAHSENVTIVRLSPNGYRLVSGSTKGTVLRLYSCLSGQLISQYHMSGQLSTLLDLCFTPEGTAIACLNLANELNLFHTNMSELELISQTARRGCEIYERENPKSLLSFLGWAREEWKYERPFSYFVLTTNSIEGREREETEKERLREVRNEKKPSRQEISEIVQESIHLEMGSELIPSNITESSREKEDEHKSKTVSNEMQLEEIVKDAPKESPPKSKRESTNSKASPNRPIRPMSLKKAKAASIKSGGLLRKASDMVVTVRVEEKELQIRGVVHFCDATNLKILRSKYFYKLKYDPFNGGEMVESLSFNLLKHPTFKHIE